MAIAKHCGDNTTDLPPTLADNLRLVRARIDRAAAVAGRAGAEIALVAVSKTHPAGLVAELHAAGQHRFGENRVQEARGKFSELITLRPQATLHLIGGLQTNKARDAVRIADVIESLDRPALADAIADAIQREARSPLLLVQVNVGDEPQKSGVPRDEADLFIEACRARFGNQLVGLMCVPPDGPPPDQHFAWLAQCAARHGLGVLSMGMSGDFEIAIAHGATHVRVGSAIFGRRPDRDADGP